MISCVDLFCGIGGLTHGLLRGGIHVVAGIDIDPQCRFPYEWNNEAKFIQRDVSTVTATELRKFWGRTAYKLLAGCAPCQSFSKYSRQGREMRPDKKWSLVAVFGELIDKSQPDLVTMENVPQLLEHSVFSDFLESLRGYHVWYEAIDCARFGVPQTRKRLVLIASRLGPISLIRNHTG